MTVDVRPTRTGADAVVEAPLDEACRDLVAHLIRIDADRWADRREHVRLIGAKGPHASDRRLDDAGHEPAPSGVDRHDGAGSRRRDEHRDAVSDPNHRRETGRARDDRVGVDRTVAANDVLGIRDDVAVNLAHADPAPPRKSAGAEEPLDVRLDVRLLDVPSLGIRLVVGEP